MSVMGTFLSSISLDIVLMWVLVIFLCLGSDESSFPNECII